jgi:ribonuclease D
MIIFVVYQFNYVSALKCRLDRKWVLNSLSSGSNSNRNLEYIQSTSELTRIVEFLSNCNEIALDLEFDRNRFSYGFNICLIQMHGLNKTIIVDPLAKNINLSLLFKNIFENEKILKVIHSPLEDISLLQSLGCFPKNIFDTERCARLLNYPFTSLSLLVFEILGIELDKSDQKSNWLKRPLTSSQLVYAQNDVLHLLKLKDALYKKVIDKGIVEWMNEENLYWSQYRYIPKSDNSLVSKRDEKMLSKYELYLFNSLLSIREKYAKAINKPGHYIISKEIMINYVKNHQSVPKLNLHIKKGVHSMFRQNLTISLHFEEVYANAKINATKMNLSTDCKISKGVKDNVNNDMAHYESVKNILCKEYGNNTANYILPNNLIKSLSMNQTVLEDIQYLYRRKLIQQYL